MLNAMISKTLGKTIPIRENVRACEKSDLRRPHDNLKDEG